MSRSVWLIPLFVMLLLASPALAQVAADLSARTDAVKLPVGTTAQRPTPANGMIRYNSSTPAIEGYVNGSWISIGGGSTTLNAITAATSTNTINNATFAQTWNWNSLTTGTAFTLGSNSMTSGNILSISNTNASSTGGALNV